MKIRKFLAFSEAAARAADIEPQRHQLLLALRGLPAGARPTVGALAGRCVCATIRPWRWSISWKLALWSSASVARWIGGRCCSALRRPVARCSRAFPSCTRSNCAGWGRTWWRHSAKSWAPIQPDAPIHSDSTGVSSVPTVKGGLDRHQVGALQPQQLGLRLAATDDGRDSGQDEERLAIPPERRRARLHVAVVCARLVEVVVTDEDRVGVARREVPSVIGSARLKDDRLIE
jgi:hypothetical protein